MHLIPLLIAIALTFPSMVSALEAGDAICKGQTMPPSFVPVGEIESPECEGTAEPRKAWVLGALAPGVTACTAPDYTRDPAPNIGYVACGRVFSKECPSNLDGTSNAVVLQRPSTCIQQAPTCTARSSDAQGAVEQLQIGQSCILAQPLAGGKRHIHPDFSFGTWWQVSSSQGKALIIKPLPGKSWPICVQPNINAFATGDKVHYQRRPPHTLPLEWHGPLSLITRLFYDDQCPGTSESLNAMVVTTYSVDEWRGKEMYACEPPSGYTVKLDEQENSSDGSTFFYTALCGSAENAGRPNARRYRFHSYR